jgi:ribosome maturation factor RimP
MNRYAVLVGKRVEVHYRLVNNTHQKSVGTLVTDTGESIFIEEHFSQGERQKTIRVEIPYEYVIRVVEASAANEASEPASPPSRRSRR